VAMRASDGRRSTRTQNARCVVQVRRNSAARVPRSNQVHADAAQLRRKMVANMGVGRHVAQTVSRDSVERRRD